MNPLWLPSEPEDTDALASEGLRRLELDPPPFVWGNIEARLDAADALNARVDEWVRNQLTELAPEAPAYGWDAIARQLDAAAAQDAQLDGIFRRQLHDISLEAPTGSLARLAARLEADEQSAVQLDKLFRTALATYEAPAPAEAWPRVAAALSTPEKTGEAVPATFMQVVRPVRAAVPFWGRPAIRWAAAACMAGLLFVGGWVMMNQSQFASQDTTLAFGYTSHLPALPSVEVNREGTGNEGNAVAVLQNYSHTLQPSPTSQPLINENGSSTASDLNPALQVSSPLAMADIQTTNTPPMYQTGEGLKEIPKSNLAEAMAVSETDNKPRLVDRVSFREMPIALESRRVEDGRFWRVNLRNIGVEFSGFRAIAAENEAQ